LPTNVDGHQIVPDGSFL